jgi:nucleoside-diphosphate-sugar epimerase
MPQDLVLLTGATGFVGFGVLLELLEQKYRVRLAVRSQSRFELVKTALARTKHASAASELEFSVVPDMAVSRAFDESAKGVRFIVHVASSIPAAFADYQKELIDPAVNITTTVLETALQEPSVKKVVITSSVAAVLPDVPEGPFDADTVVPDPEGPFTHPFYAYVASKKLALSATRKFIAGKKPQFDIVNVMPTFVIGPNGMARTKEEYKVGSNAIVLSPLLGLQFPEPRPSSACHVDDVALVHVNALKPEFSGHRNFGVGYNGLDGVEWEAIDEIARRRLPDLVEKGVLPLGGTVAGPKLPFDGSKTEKAMGLKFKSLEDMVVDLGRDYARVAAQESA